jgi:DNA-binding transcriptional regulator YbjK
VPPTTADRIADATLEILGTGGLHALSHARVDATAGLPPGSTSNYCRTRAALVASAVARLGRHDDEQWAATVAAARPATIDDLVAGFAAFVEVTTGRRRGPDPAPPDRIRRDPATRPVG